MSQQKSFAVIGGDMRQIFLANSLADDNMSVTAYGFDEGTQHLRVKPSLSLADAIKNAGIIILPLPALSEAGIINTPFFSGKIEACELLESMNKNQILLGGKIETSLKTLADIHNVYSVDYFLREELTVLNAIPTAEGGISIALSEMPTTLCGSRCLVTGFGRIGKVLAKMLDGIGAKVCVAARKPEAFAWVDVYGYEKCRTNEIEKRAGSFDVIFNTVPARLFDERTLKNVRSDCLIIDLASKPGGVDFEAAKNLGVKVIWALSLPGRVAPISAGVIIKQTILNICTELGV